MKRKLGYCFFILTIGSLSTANGDPNCFVTYTTSSKICLNRDNSSIAVLTYKDSLLRFDDRYRMSNIYILDYTSDLYAFDFMTGFDKTELILFKILNSEITLLRSEPFTAAVQNRDFMRVVSYKSQLEEKCPDGRLLATALFNNNVVQSKLKRCIRATFSQDVPRGNKLERTFIETRNNCASRIIAPHEALPELNPRKASCIGSSYDWAKKFGFDPIIAE